jgi:hypothetical protein
VRVVRKTLIKQFFNCLIPKKLSQFLPTKEISKLFFKINITFHFMVYCIGYTFKRKVLWFKTDSGVVFFSLQQNPLHHEQWMMRNYDNVSRATIK